jgi:hypothetical protein
MSEWMNEWTPMNKTNQMHTSLKIFKLYLFLHCCTCFGHSCAHHQEPLTLHLQPPVTVCRWVGCVFQLWSVTAASGWFYSLLSSLMRGTLNLTEWMNECLESEGFLHVELCRTEFSSRATRRKHCRPINHGTDVRIGIWFVFIGKLWHFC